MIITRLRGGLGNQMFQYAYGRAEALRRGIALHLDTTWFSSPGALNPRRTYDLGMFRTQPKIASRLGIVWAKLTGHYLDGFWQSESYFSDVADLIRADFTFTDPIGPTSSALANEIRNSASVCINVRRDDFIKDGKFVGAQYYIDAAERMKSLVPNCRFFIFSDDMEWCREHLSILSPAPTFVGHEHAGEKFGTYLQLMTLCKHFIIPNSTFGWWAAWLATNPSKHIIAPKIWSQGGGTATEGVVPESWIRM